MSLVKRLLYIPVILLLGFGFYLMSEHLFQRDLMFHTDIARDFLLIEDIIETKDPTLIGPKAGGIPGMFFGPVWLYAHIPLFFLGGGDPVIIAYFWVLLVTFSVVSVFFIAYKIFGKISAVVAILIYTFFAATFSTGFTQSFGSVLLAPWLLYAMYLYLEKKRVMYLILALLINGFIYQMQPAVGMITLPVTMTIVFYTVIKRKKYSHLLSYLILVIPFSTYILFELRHDFLQVRAFINHFTAPNVQDDSRLSFTEYLHNRTDSYFNIIDLIKRGVVTNTIFLFLYGFIAYRLINKKKFAGETFYKLFFAYVMGFIVMSFIYKGIIIDYYYWAFLPLSVIAFSGVVHTIPKVLFAGLTIAILYTAFNTAIGYRGWWNTGFTGVDVSSWKLNKEAAEFIYRDSQGNDFGYFVYSTDEFGHSIKYAMNYVQRTESSNGMLCEKKETTYLIYYPTPSDAKTDPVYWKEVRVKLQKEPVSTKKIRDITIEKYVLADRETQERADPNIVCNLHFR